LDYGSERCSLVRQFGSEDATAHLQIDSFGFWNKFRVLINGTAVPAPRGPSGKAFLSRTGDPGAREESILEGKVNNTAAISFDLDFAPYVAADAFKRMSDEEQKQRRLALDRPVPSLDAAVDSLTVRVRNRTLVFHTGTMAAPLAAMRACVDDLYKSWGVDPSQQKALSRLPEPTGSTLNHITTDYPPSAVFSGANAYVPVRITVDADGKTSACVIQVDGVDKAFTDAVCQHLRGAFKPALDADAKPVQSIYHNSVLYLIGGPG
jgi:hypothetical protein